MAHDQKSVLKQLISKVRLVDAGVKNKYNADCAVPSKSSEDRVYYPSLYLSTKEAPILSGSEVGDEVCLLIKAKVTSHSLNERTDSEKNENFNLDIHKIGVIYTHKEDSD